jgi:hypothetical protein
VFDRTRLEKLAMDKNSSLLRKFTNYGCKFFITSAPWMLYYFIWENDKTVASCSPAPELITTVKKFYSRCKNLYFTWIWNLAVGKVFHEQNTEGPDVRLDGELAERDGFRRRPLDRKPGALMGRVLVVDNDAGEAEVGHLGDLQSMPLTLFSLFVVAEARTE